MRNIRRWIPLGEHRPDGTFCQGLVANISQLYSKITKELITIIIFRDITCTSRYHGHFMKNCLKFNIIAVGIMKQCWVSTLELFTSNYHKVSIYVWRILTKAVMIFINIWPSEKVKIAGFYEFYKIVGMCGFPLLHIRICVFLSFYIMI